MSHSEDTLITSAFSRFMKIGGMVSNVGFSILGNGTLNLFSSEVKKAQRNAEFWFNNGQKILETLGKLKGGAMKIGQMLSLQEGLMPPELLQVIQLLQKEAPPLPFSTMETVLKEDFPDYKEIFSTIEEKPFASASIGQVHRGTLKDGREVAIKIQYPQIDEIIKSDLKNLRVLFKLLFSTFLKINIESIWEELNRQLLYELDYQMEFKNQNRFASIYKNSNIVYVPLPIQEASSQRVLSSEFVQAYDIHDIQKGNFEQSLLDLWGTNLYRSFIEQMFVHRFLHADPNIGNFAFRSDGQIILYDFGSVKVLPEDFVLSFKKILQHLLNKELSEMPQALKELGIYHADGRTIEEEITSEYGELMKPVFSKGGFSFAGERHIFKALIRVKEKYTWKLMDIQVPADLIFVNRTLIGLSGNLNALHSFIDVRGLIEEFL